MRDAVSERDWFEESLLTPASLDQATRYHRFGMGTTGEPQNTDAYPARSHRFGAYISGCSHLMHEHCMANYFDATRYRHTQQVQRHHPENAVRSEYLCPLCKSLGNMLIPLDKPLVQLRSHFNKEGKVPTLREKMRDVSSEGLLRVRDSSKIWDHHVDTGELMPWFSDCIFHAASGKDQPYRREMRLSARMIERYRQLVRPLSDQSQMIRQKKAHMYIPNDIVNYTISAVEVSYRGLAMPLGALSVAEQVSESTTRLISRLIGSLQLELDLFFGKKYDRTALRVGIFARLLPDWYRASTLPTPLVCRNPLTLVIETAAIAPDLLHSVIHMGFFAEITRLMLGACMWIKRCLGGRARPSARSSPPADPHLAQALAAWRGIKPIILSSLRQNAGPFTEAEPTLALISDDELAKIMYSHTLPYLRRCAIIFYACTGRYPAPDALDGMPNGVSGTCEYTRLLKLLALPNPIEVLSAPTSTEGPMVGRWLSQWTGQGRMIPSLEYPGVYELARLPRKWEDVVIKYTDTRCDVCGTVPANPALCLLCGRFVCMAGDCCADGEQGECNAHMRE
jgi:E3 ubiquitin-protein ligase UBR1